MKKVLSAFLAVILLTSLAIYPISAAEQSVYLAYDAFELKNGSTPWSFQHVLIGQDNYEDLEFIENGWYYEFYHNWAQGAVPSNYAKDKGKAIGFHAGQVCDPVLTFTAPRDGNIQIPQFTVWKLEDAGDGVDFQILKNDVVIYPQDADWYVSETIPYEIKVPDIFLTVKKGDRIFFRVNMRSTQHNDGLYIIGYQMKYLSEEAYTKGVSREGVVAVNKEPLKSAEKIQVNFTDIDSHWGKTYIVPLAENGIIKGKTATTFEPDANITRAEFMTLALKVGGIEAVAGESYADVATSAWFSNTIATAKSLKLIDENMTKDGNFYPDQNITREEMTSVIVKLYESQKTQAKAGDVTVFTDNASFSPWATDSIGKAVALGVVAGNPDGTFNALGNATRAEAAVIFSRLLNLL